MRKKLLILTLVALTQNQSLEEELNPFWDKISIKEGAI